MRGRIFMWLDIWIKLVFIRIVIGLFFTWIEHGSTWVLDYYDASMLYLCNAIVFRHHNYKVSFLYVRKIDTSNLPHVLQHFLTMLWQESFKLRTNFLHFYGIVLFHAKIIVLVLSSTIAWLYIFSKYLAMRCH